MIHDGRQRRHFCWGPPPGLLRGAAPELLILLRQAGTPELFRRDTLVALGAVREDPLAVVGGRLSLVRALVNGPALPVATLRAGDILCPGALHPMVRANSFLRAEEDAMAYAIPREHLGLLRMRRPELAAALDREVNTLLQRLQAETAALLESLRRHADSL